MKRLYVSSEISFYIKNDCWATETKALAVLIRRARSVEQSETFCIASSFASFLLKTMELGQKGHQHLKMNGSLKKTALLDCIMQEETRKGQNDKTNKNKKIKKFLASHNIQVTKALLRTLGKNLIRTVLFSFLKTRAI